jgi:hypothetical protein
MPMHLGTSWVQNISKMRLDADHPFWEFSGLFPELIFIFHEIILFIRRL